jgi:23S rRNA (cytosine1962-C5)-methyltransferase
MHNIILKSGRETAVLRHHPWIFSGAIHKVTGDPQLGETVIVMDAKKQPLAIGAYSPHSQIRVRMWAFTPDAIINQDFFLERLQAAQRRRESLLDKNVTAYRLVNSEADELPGITIDVYGNYIVLQCLSAGAYYCRDLLLTALQNLFPHHTIFEKSEGSSLKKEGLSAVKTTHIGELPPAFVRIQEHQLSFNVDILNGHKTGFYLDQRDNRQLVYHVSANKRVLNCCAYTGGFGIAALAGGASHVIHIESSAKFAEQIKTHVELNHLDANKNEVVVADVFEQLRIYAERGEQFDLIILDPPKFADAKHQLITACRGYKDINRLAMQLLKPGGDLFTFSCSGAITPDLFSKVVADAAVDAQRRVFVRQRLWQAPDHTTNIFFPEGLYLKGLWCRVE